MWPFANSVQFLDCIALNYTCLSVFRIRSCSFGPAWLRISRIIFTIVVHKIQNFLNVIKTSALCYRKSWFSVSITVIPMLFRFLISFKFSNSWVSLPYSIEKALLYNTILCFINQIDENVGLLLILKLIHFHSSSEQCHRIICHLSSNYEISVWVFISSI